MVQSSAIENTEEVGLQILEDLEDMDLRIEPSLEQPLRKQSRSSGNALIGVSKSKSQMKLEVTTHSIGIEKNDTPVKVLKDGQPGDKTLQLSIRSRQEKGLKSKKGTLASQGTALPQNR